MLMGRGIAGDIKRVYVFQTSLAPLPTHTRNYTRARSYIYVHATAVFHPSHIYFTNEWNRLVYIHTYTFYMSVNTHWCVTPVNFSRISEQT